MRFEYFKDLFYKELERKEHINTRHNWTVGVFIILIGANIYCLNLIFELKNVEWAMILLYGCTTAATILGGVFLAIPMRMKKGKDLPLALDQKNYYATLESHYPDSDDKYKIVDATFSNYLVDLYVEGTDDNKKTTDSKSKMTALGSTSMLVSLVFLLLTYVVVAPEKANQDDIIKVKVIEGRDISVEK